MKVCQGCNKTVLQSKYKNGRKNIPVITIRYNEIKVIFHNLKCLLKWMRKIEKIENYFQYKNMKQIFIYAKECQYKEMGIPYKADDAK